MGSGNGLAQRARLVCLESHPRLPMSSPRSRSKTTGAFGNRNPRSIERDFSTPAPVQKEKTPRTLTIADKLAKFSQPILEQAATTAPPRKVP